MRAAAFASLLFLAACADQAPEASLVVLPAEFGPASDVLEVRATIPDTRVPIDEPFFVDVHLRNPSAEPVTIVSGCIQFVYLYARQGAEELGLDGSGLCLPAGSAHHFEAGEEKVVRLRAWARWDDVYAPRRYTLGVGTHAYDGVPRIEESFEVR